MVRNKELHIFFWKLANFRQSKLVKNFDNRKCRGKHDTLCSEVAYWYSFLFHWVIVLYPTSKYFFFTLPSGY